MRVIASDRNDVGDPRPRFRACRVRVKGVMRKRFSLWLDQHTRQRGARVVNIDGSF